MEQITHKNVNYRVNSKVNSKPKAPPPPKPKPPKLSASNKIDTDPNSSSTPPKRTNSNASTPRGTNVHKLSSVFEDYSKDDSSLKPRMAPSLPLSPNLPVPTVTIKKSKSFTRDKNKVENKSIEIDESPLVFGDIKAKFQQAEDRT